jgi:hypothetical protein
MRSIQTWLRHSGGRVKNLSQSPFSFLINQKGRVITNDEPD